MKIYIIRHGEAAKSWEVDRDPELSLRGREQAQNISDILVQEDLNDFQKKLYKTNYFYKIDIVTKLIKDNLQADISYGQGINNELSYLSIGAAWNFRIFSK